MFAIHRVNYDNTLSTREADGVVRAIEHHGYILPHGELVRQGLSGNMCFGLDYLAGDCEYVFLKPIADDWQGWLQQFNITDAFVFDLDVLMSHGALYGIRDLLEDYTQACFEAAIPVIGNKVYRLYVPMFYDLLLEKAYGIRMSAMSKRTYNASAYRTKLELQGWVDDIIEQGLVESIVGPARKACGHVQNLERLSGRFAEPNMSSDSTMLNKLLRIASNEGWTSQHSRAASELSSDYQQLWGREVLFPGPLPVSLAIHCP
jgi:hypothetical protein